MLMFLLKSAGHILRDASKHSLEQTTRAIAGTAIAWGGYSLYRQSISLLEHHGFFGDGSNNKTIETNHTQENDTHLTKR